MSRLVRSCFNTTDLPQLQRFDVWQGSIASLFDVELHNENQQRRFDTRMTSYLVNDQIIVSRCATAGQRFERNSLKVATDNLDYYMLQTHLTGTQQVRRGKQNLHVKPGDLLVIDLAETHEGVTSDFDQLTIIVPRHLLAPHLLHPDSQEGRVLSAEQPLAQMAVSHMKMLFELMGSFSEDEAVHAMNPMVALMASALNGSADTVEKGKESIDANRCQQVRMLIEQQLAEKICVQDICEKFGISRAKLYRMFEPYGGISAYIQERRLRHCAHALVSPEQVKRHIYDIAYRHGFTSEAHFSRAFRARFGTSPSEVRGAYLDRLKRTADPAFNVADRMYETWVTDTMRI